MKPLPEQIITLITSNQVYLRCEEIAAKHSMSLDDASDLNMLTRDILEGLSHPSLLERSIIETLHTDNDTAIDVAADTRTIILQPVMTLVEGLYEGSTENPVPHNLPIKPEEREVEVKRFFDNPTHPSYDTTGLVPLIKKPTSSFTSFAKPMPGREVAAAPRPVEQSATIPTPPRPAPSILDTRLQTSLNLPKEEVTITPRTMPQTPKPPTPGLENQKTPFSNKDPYREPIE